MNVRKLFPMAVIFTLVLTGGFSLVRGLPPQGEPNKGRPTPHVSPPPPSPEEQPRQLGGPGLGGRAAQIDSTMQRVTLLVEQAQVLSKSFGELAGLHHGADKSEVLMMQRMSDAMGAMAGEVKASLDAYKKMLDDETASDSGMMKAEVESLWGVLAVIAAQIDQALDMLQRLRSDLGQG